MYDFGIILKTKKFFIIKQIKLIALKTNNYEKLKNNQLQVDFWIMAQPLPKEWCI